MLRAICGCVSFAKARTASNFWSSLRPVDRGSALKLAIAANDRAMLDSTSGGRQLIYNRIALGNEAFDGLDRIRGPIRRSGDRAHEFNIVAKPCHQICETPEMRHRLLSGSVRHERSVGERPGDPGSMFLSSRTTAWNSAR